MKRKSLSILLALVLVLTLGLVTAVPVAAQEPDEVWVDLNFARDIDGVLSPGEWGQPLCIKTEYGESVTVYAYANMDTLYLAFDSTDNLDERAVVDTGSGANDVLDWNVGLVGSDTSWRYTLHTKAQSDTSWGDFFSTIDNDGTGKVYRGTWGVVGRDPHYSSIPEGIEMVTSFATGHRVTEFKIPMSLMFDGTHGWDGPNAGDVLLLGGTIQVEPDDWPNYPDQWEWYYGTLFWPEGIDHGNADTFATIEVQDRPSTPLDGRTFGLDAFVTIQGGINAVAGSIVNVAAGTYDEDVTVGKDLILNGAQVGTDPRGGRVDGESEIVGVVVVTSATTDVVFDGFKFTSPTRAFEPRGFNLRIESDSSTVTNNIFVAEENAGHPYAGYLDFEGITNATVTQNSFFGHLDLIQIPNVVRLGITGAGVVNVTDNEMHDVGGGGGIGIMCTNELAIINITSNDIDHTGDGIWVYQDPSAFDTLSITNNNIYHNNACHGSECQNTDTGIKLVGIINGTVVVSGNDFVDNQIQVDNTAGAVGLEQVLADNTFDRAVTVDSEGASLLPTIWSFIQDGIDAAQTDDTVIVADGTYTENVVIPLGKDNLQLIGDGSTVTSIAPASGRPVALSGNLGLIDGFTIKGFTLVTADANYAFIALSGTVGPPPYTTNLELEDVVVDGGIYGIGLNAVNGVTLTNVHLSNISGGGQGALELTGVSDLLFTRGSIEDNAIGVRLQISPGPWGDYGPNDNIQIHNSNLTGNTIAIENQDSGTEIDATYNWWGNASGPADSARFTESGYEAYGDAVSTNVDYEPWLLVEDGTPYDKTLALKKGWTLVSTDKAVDSLASVGETLAYEYTPTGGFVSEVTTADLEPLTAIYVKTQGGGGVGFNYPADADPTVYTKDLGAGWNLISTTSSDITANALLSQLHFATVGTQLWPGLTTLVSQGNYNQFSGDFYLATWTDADWIALESRLLNPFDGYWASMEAAETFEVIPQ